tara:strand:+ start:52 stop:366 length:315 start_codon:yes stop_codon:yes gene_type:complete
MVATQSINLKATHTIVTSDHLTVPSNARDLIVELRISSTVSFKVMTSPDQVNWYQVGSNHNSKTEDTIVSLAGESVLQYVCVQPTSASYDSSVTSAKLYFGRSK